MPNNGETLIDYGDLTNGGRWRGWIRTGSSTTGVVTLSDGKTYRITTTEEWIHIHQYSRPRPGMIPIDAEVE